MPTVKAVAKGMKLVIEDPAQRRRIVSSIHDSSHMGVNRSLDIVSQKYYWPGHTKDVHSYVRLSTMPCIQLYRYTNNMLYSLAIQLIITYFIDNIMLNMPKE